MFINAQSTQNTYMKRVRVCNLGDFLFFYYLILSNTT